MNRYPLNAGRPKRNVLAASRNVAMLLFLSLSACDDGERAPPPATVRGTVFGSGVVAGATVSLVRAEDVARATSLGPVEDLTPASPYRTTTEADGSFSLEEIPPGRYYLYVTPAPGDGIHLPGGSLARRSLLLEAASERVTGVFLSTVPPEDATFVGSSRCLQCHPAQGTAPKTLHFVALREVTAAGPSASSLQDLSPYPDAGRAFDFFDDGNPDDNTGPGDGYGLRIATGEGYDVLLGRDGGGFFQALESAGGAVSEPLYIAFVYGGLGRFAARFMTRLDASGSFTSDASAGTYHVLPAEFSEAEGDPERGGEVTVPRWQPVHPERWAAPSAPGGAPGRTPVATESFDNDCAGCHFTGMSLGRTASGLFRAHAVHDPGGAFDYDGDGSAEEINVGCESCHGPGSQHAADAGGSIVNPAYLAAGRANVLCGRCHIRGRGNGRIDGAGEGSYPSKNDPATGGVIFPRPRIGPGELFGVEDVLPEFGTAGGFLDTVDLSTDASASWLDRTGGFGALFDHSRDFRQIYMDHVRSGHARNPFELLACWSCHDPHDRARRASLLAEVDNNVLCLRCHAGSGDFAEVSDGDVDLVEGGGTSPPELNRALNDHVKFRTFDLVGVAMNLGAGSYSNPGGELALGRCIICHMAKTAELASWITDDEGFVIEGDITSHTFDVISPDISEAMASGGREPVPNSCVPCHRGLPRGAYPDYRFQSE